MFSVIISYRESDEKRRNNLISVLNYLSWLMSGDSEIILIEQDKKSKIDWLDSVTKNQYIKHIFVQNSGTFNKGWGYNIGAKSSKNNILLFNDADVLIKLNCYKYCIDIINKPQNIFDVIKPYDSIVFLNEQSTDIFINTHYSFTKIELGENVQNGVISGGIFIIKRDSFLNLKGFDEDCFGYGHEDDIFDVKMRKMNLKIHIYRDIALHLYHDILNNDIYFKYMNNNKKLYDIYLNMDIDDLKEKIESTKEFGEIGANTFNRITSEQIKSDITDDVVKKIIKSVLEQIDDDFINDLIKSCTDEIKTTIFNILSEKLKEKFKELKLNEENKNSFFNKIKKMIFSDEQSIN